GAGQGGVAARAGIPEAAGVHHDGDAVEGDADRLGGSDVGRHVGVYAVPHHPPLVERVEKYSDRHLPAPLNGDVGGEGLGIGYQVGLTGHEVERDVLAALKLIVAADGRDSLLVVGGAIEGAIDHGALLHNAVATFPAHRDVEHDIEGPEGFEAF